MRWFLLCLISVGYAQVLPYTDVNSTNTVTLSNKTITSAANTLTIDCNISTCLNFSGGAVGANPTGTIGLTTVNGSAATFLRSDGAPPLSQSINPTWTGTHTFNGTVAGTALSTYLASPPAIGGSAAAAGSFTTLSASSTVSGAGFSTYLASPPAIGGTAPAAGAFTTLTSSSGMPLGSLASQATNTIVGNATSGSAVPTALSVGGCSSATSALIWTTNTGFGCNTSINAATLGGATFANPGAIGGGTAAAGTFTALTGTSGTLAGLTGLAIRDTSAAFDVTLAATSSTTLNAGRTLTLDMKNVAHTLAFNATANTITFPNTSSYTLIGSGDSGTVTNTMLAGSITLANLATQATNTVVGNATSGSAAPTALAVGTCSTAASALNWTTNTGFGCNTAITAASLNDTGTGADQVASGTTGQRPSVNAGQIRYNTVGYMEYYNGGRSAWLPVGGTFVICNAHPAATHTGNQSETNLATCTIPANIMGTSGMLRITAVWTRSATTTNTVTFIARHNTSSGVTSGGTVLQNPATASSGSVTQGCMTMVRNSDATHQDGGGNTQASCNFNGAYSAQTAGTIDTTATSYINFNCTDTTSSSDTCGILWYTVELII